MTTFKEIQDDLKTEDTALFFQLEVISALSAAMEEKGLSQRTLSEATGVAQKTISNVLSGTHVPRFDIICKLAVALDMEIFALPKRKKKSKKLG